MISAPEVRANRRVRPDTYLFFLVLFGLFLFATHAGMLGLPFHWDELGLFVPAARDLWLDGAWIPHSTMRTAHPPGLMALLAGVWSVFGYSVEITRAAMLALAALAVLFAFLLAIELARNAPGAPAFAAAALLCASPVFFSQAVMAQLDAPAMLLTSVALLCFLQERMPLAAIACAALVMVKETGAIVPGVLGAWLLHEKRWRDAALFAVPLAPLAAWLAAVYAATGHPFGDPVFTRDNLYYPLHPVRFGMAAVRRLHYLFLSDFHWVGTAALVYAWRRTPLFAARPWKVAGLVAAAHAAGVTVLGGAVLERYLLPSMPVLYAAMAAAILCWPPWLRKAAIVVLTAGLAAGNFWNPPYPFPAENNLAWTGFVRVQRSAAEYLATHYPGVAVATVWPLSAALARPEFGYLDRALAVHPLANQMPETVRALDWSRTPLLALYSRNLDPRWNWFHLAPVRRLWMQFREYRDEITPLEVQAHLPLRLVARWSREGWWMEIYEWEGRARGPAR